MSKELIERLREEGEWVEPKRWEQNSLCKEAADRIEELELSVEIHTANATAFAEEIDRLEAMLSITDDECLKKALAKIRVLEAELVAMTKDRDEWKFSTIEANKRFKYAEKELAAVTIERDLNVRQANAYQQQFAALKAELSTHVAALDEQMTSACLGVFNQGDDPKATIKLLMDWAQEVGAFFAKEEIKHLQEELVAVGEERDSFQDQCIRLKLDAHTLKAQEPVAWVRYSVGLMPHFVPVINGAVTFECSAIEALEYQPLYATPVPSIPDGYALVKRTDLHNAYSMASWNAHDQRAAQLLGAMIDAAMGEKKE